MSYDEPGECTDGCVRDAEAHLSRIAPVDTEMREYSESPQRACSRAKECGPRGVTAQRAGVGGRKHASHERGSRSAQQPGQEGSGDSCPGAA